MDTRHCSCAGVGSNCVQGAIHTAAASALGKMLVRLCKLEGFSLLNVVRRQEQKVERGLFSSIQSLWD